MADEITLLRFPENVRKRKEMYLIDCNHCNQEIIDNAVDEFNAGFATTIIMEVKKSPEGQFEEITITDDGRGIPTAPSNDPDHIGETQAEVALGNLTAGGKFGGESGYKTITSGLHGVGASCVNATSSMFTAVIEHNGTRTELCYEKGILVSKEIEKPVRDKKVHGTKITYRLDETLWTDDVFDFAKIRRRLKQLTYLNAGLKIIYKDDSLTEEYFHPEGLSDYFKDISSGKVLFDPEPIRISKVVVDEKVGNIGIDIVFGYTTGYSTEIFSYVNSVSTPNGGDHYAGFTAGILKAVNTFFAQDKKYEKLMKNISAEDTREGIYGIISVKVMSPRFEGQSKASIKMSEVRAAVNSVVVSDFGLYLECHPSFVKQLADKMEKAYKSRQAAKRARDAARGVKSALEVSLPGKLAACSSKKPEECSLYIVEGDSAAGSAIQGRDSKTQAILPVFGKILNTEKCRPEEAVTNGKILDVVKAMRTGIGKDFDIRKLRYHKIIIMADQDVDGFHISTLWITFFYRFMPEIIHEGHLYIQLSPLYRVTEYVGKKEVDHYFFSDEELAKFKTKNKIHTSYIKGLGELQPKQLWESTMDPSARRLIRVTAEDAELAGNAVSRCMGDDIDARKRFIQENADFGKILD